MGCDHRLLARLKGAIKIVGKDEIAGDEAARMEGVLELARQIDQHETCARFSAARLIWVKLCIADESIPVTRRKSNTRKRHSGSLANRAFTC